MWKHDLHTRVQKRSSRTLKTSITDEDTGNQQNVKTCCSAELIFIHKKALTFNKTTPNISFVHPSIHPSTHSNTEMRPKQQKRLSAFRKSEIRKQGDIFSFPHNLCTCSAQAWNPQLQPHQQTGKTRKWAMPKNAYPPREKMLRKLHVSAPENAWAIPLSMRNTKWVHRRLHPVISFFLLTWAFDERPKKKRCPKKNSKLRRMQVVKSRRNTGGRLRREVGEDEVGKTRCKDRTIETGGEAGGASNR